MTLEDIGKHDGALLCMTNLTTCCRNGSRSVLGQWFFPNGTRVSSEQPEWDFFRDRGQMIVFLHRRRGGVDGIYHCMIPDSMNVTQTIYIGVYNTSTGEWHYSALLFCFNFILLCLYCNKEEIVVTKLKVIVLYCICLRWHGSLSAKVNKNAILGYSHDRGLS